MQSTVTVKVLEMLQEKREVCSAWTVGYAGEKCKRSEVGLCNFRPLGSRTGRDHPDLQFPEHQRDKCST